MSGWVQVGELMLPITKLQLLKGRLLVTCFVKRSLQQVRAKPVLIGQDGEPVFYGSSILDLPRAPKASVHITWEIKYDPIAGRPLAAGEKAFT